MSGVADLKVYDKDGQMVAVVEYFANTGKNREWAAELRRNILEHELT